MVALLARAGRDQVFLVTVVPTVLQQAQGNQLLIRYYQQLSQVLIQVRIRASPSVAFDPPPPLIDPINVYAVTAVPQGLALKMFLLISLPVISR